MRFRPQQRPSFARHRLIIALVAMLGGEQLAAQTPTPTPKQGLVNISTRLHSEAGDNGLFGGFIITGNARKRVIIRALGPSLGIPGTIVDPVLTLTNSQGFEVYNNDWRENEQAVQATGIPPADDVESAIVADLNPGQYTAIVDDKGTRSGIALVEIYDLGPPDGDTGGAAKLAELSSRGPVRTGDNVMIGGFIIAEKSTRVILRAIGPSLVSYVIQPLEDPTLELHNGSGSLITSNDDWRSDQEQEIIDTGVSPKDDRESAIVATLAPANYTAIVRGKNGVTGLAVVEVYDLN
jgi:hypothetical protein